MARAVLLGIDIGTTGVRAALFADDGTLIADANQSCPHDAPQPGWAEVDPESWWRAAIRVLADIAARHDLASVACVAIAGQAPTVVLVDAAGAVVRPAI